MFLLTAKNIWPDAPLKDAKIEVEIPEMILNEIQIPARKVVFQMNYERVKKERGTRTCPSTDHIFHFNP